MTTAVFDTLKASQNLKAAGVDERQAEAIVVTMAEAFDDTVATKADISEVRAEISEVRAEISEVRAEISEVRADLKTSIADLKTDMFKVAMGVAIAIILANATMTIALIRFLP